MKIHADKLESNPPHKLRIRDIKFLLARIPPDWITQLKEVHLSNSLEYYSPYACFHPYDGRLTVYSRRGTTEQCVRAILSALAVVALGMGTGLRGRSAAEKHRLNELIQPLLDQIMMAIAPQKREYPPHFASPKVLEVYPNPLVCPIPPPLPWTPKIIASPALNTDPDAT